MNITIHQLGYLQTNCYIVADGAVCAVVDPGDAGDRLADWLGSKELTPVCVLLTHGHFDHVGGVAALRRRFPEIPIYVHEADTHLTPKYCRGLEWTRHYAEGDEVSVGSLTVRVLHTPGHTPGSVCLQCEDVLLSGDTLFAGSIGRTDFPLGDYGQMQQSLQRLAALEGDFRVLPGHGGETALSLERKYNPYF